MKFFYEGSLIFGISHTSMEKFVPILKDGKFQFREINETGNEEILESAIDDTVRIDYMRDKLKTSLDDWSEEHPSLSIHEFKIDAHETLIFCGVVDGYSSEIEWLPPSRSLEEVYKKTAALGFLSDNEELEALTDSELLALWY